MQTNKNQRAALLNNDDMNAFFIELVLFRGKKLIREKCVATRNVEKLFVQSFDVCLNASHILWK